MNESRNFNYGTNNNTNENGGKMNMTSNMFMTMEEFVGAVTKAMGIVYGEGYRVEMQEVVKNNNCRLTALCIRKDGGNMAPTIYLERFFDEYKKGKSMKQICKEIIRIYEDSKMEKDFDTAGLMDYEQTKDRICYKLINAEKNQKLLSEAPHIIFHDLAIIFYILVSKNSNGTATIIIRNNLKNIWVVDTEELYSIALRNTQRLFRGNVVSMTSVISEILSDSKDDEFTDQFFDMMAGEADTVPMFVATNTDQMNGAGIILYDSLLKEFAARIGSDFYILPSSVHECLFVSAFHGPDERELVAMVREINATQVAEDEVLSDNVYRYNRVTDRVEMV